MNFEDKQLICIDCNAPFTLTAGEQDYFISNNLIEPKRCKKCRKIKTAQMRELKAKNGEN